MIDLKQGQSILVTGRRKSGKTPWIKNVVLQSRMPNKFVFDRRKEFDINIYTTFYKMSNFKNFVTTREIQNSAIVIEEATGFIGSSKDQEIADWLAGSQHNRNLIFFCFHSLMDTPKFLIRNSDFLVLFPTNDIEKDVKNDRSSIYPFWKIKTQVKHNGHINPLVIDLNEIN